MDRSSLNGNDVVREGGFTLKRKINKETIVNQKH